MQRDQIGRGTEIPTFLAGDMADLQAYIRARGLRSDTRVELLPLPDPARGAQVFRASRINRRNPKRALQEADMAIGMNRCVGSRICKF